MRKVLIALGAFICVLIGFWIYAKWMDTAPIPVQQAHDTPEMKMPEIESEMQAIAGAKLITVDASQYFKYDPVTKDLVAEYGFEKVLNPGEGSSRWRVDKPYIIFYRSNFQCRIDSERGTFQIESAGDHNVPKDAQLNENVVIHITPTSNSKVKEATVFMDDLTFSSERSEFSTDGPVKIESEQIEMSGYGLVLIFNTGLGKVEYLQVKDMDFLRLKNFAASDSPLASGKQQQSVPGKSPSETQPDSQVIADSATVSQDPQMKSSDELYRCNIRDNVLIRYANELVVSGAEQVDIMNISFSGGNDTSSQAISDTEDQTSADDDPSIVNKTQVASSSQIADSQETASSDVSHQDVFVQCDGGMVIQPMKPRIGTDTGEADDELTLEMSGTPLKIDRVAEDTAGNSETIAHCGALYYRPNEDILRLFTNTQQPQILLNTNQSHSRIETQGNVLWDRKAQRANIAGPGKVYIGDSHDPAAAPSEIAFDGMMDLLFAKMPNDVGSAAIRTINLTGGMDAVLRQNGTLKTLADTAVLEFGGQNQLSHARLDGDVHFESLEKGKTSSQAAAESAVFYFDNNQIAKADLSGAVHFVSATGQMDSSNARIEFTPDTNGKMHPKMIRTDGDAVLRTLSSESQQPPAKFEAKKIDYDMQTGNGLAHGPIRFTFYQPPDSNEISDISTMVPVTITADECARFVADENREVQQVVFQKNVIATRIFETPLYTQRDEFHGDKLIVDIEQGNGSTSGIRQITFTEGKVFGQSQKLRGNEPIFQVRLTCQKMVHDQTTGIITVTGPGEIQLNNSKAEMSATRSSGVNFERPCYVLINGFDNIEWSLKQQQITANGDEKAMQFAYVPLIDGQPEKFIYVSSQKLNADYSTNDTGKPVVEHVFTNQGITYTEMDDKREKVLRTLIGQELEYNALSDVGWLTISGSEANPCFVDGNRVPAIRYNVTTGQLKTSLSSQPGIFTR